MAVDAHKNFAYSTVLTAPSPATSGASLVVQSGDGALFPTPPFNATVWPAGTQPTVANAEIVRVTNISTDTLTITRAQESTSARTIIIGDQIANTETAKTLTDIETGFLNLSGVSAGQTAYGGTGSGDNLTLHSTSNSTRGYIALEDTSVGKVFVRGTAGGSGNTNTTFAVSHTDTWAGGQSVTANDLRSIPTFTTTGAGVFTGADLTTLANNSAAMASITGVFFQAAPTGTGLVDTTIGAAVFASTFGSGAQTTLARSVQIQVGALAGTVTTGVGVDVLNGQFLGSTANAIGLRVQSLPGSTLKIGLDVAAQTGATTNIGIRNAATEVYTPALSTISAVSSTISHAQALTRLNNSTAGSLTLTSAPTITDGQDGEILVVFNSGTQDVVIQDQGTLASSNLRLGASTRTLSTRDNITLMFSSTIGDWIEIGFVNVV